MLTLLNWYCGEYWNHKKKITYLFCGILILFFEYVLKYWYCRAVILQNNQWDVQKKFGTVLIQGPTIWEITKKIIFNKNETVC